MVSKLAEHQKKLRCIDDQIEVARKQIGASEPRENAHGEAHNDQARFADLGGDLSQFSPPPTSMVQTGFDRPQMDNLRLNAESGEESTPNNVYPFPPPDIQP